MQPPEGSARRCAYCARASRAVCPRCGRRFCAEHGTLHCIVCTDPQEVLPSPWLFRSALAALVVALALGAWFLVASGRPSIPTTLAAAEEVPTPISEVTVAPPSPPTPTPTPLPHIEHAIVAGDNLWDLAQRYGTTVEAIERLNALSPTQLLQIGQVLLIPRQPP